MARNPESKVFIRAEDRASSVFQKFRRNAATAFRSVSRDFKVLGLAGAAAFTSLSVATKKTISSLDEMAKTARRIDLPLEDLQAYRLLVQDAGGDVSKFTRGIFDFNKNIGNFATGISSRATKAMEALGVQLTDTNGKVKGTNELFREIITQLSQMSNEQEKAAIANRIFGGSWKTIVTTFREGADQADKYREQLRAMGALITSDITDRAEAAQSALDRSTAVITGNFNRLIAKNAELVQRAAGNVAAFSALAARVFERNAELILGSVDNVLAGIGSLLAKNPWIKGALTAYAVLQREELTILEKLKQEEATLLKITQGNVPEYMRAGSARQEAAEKLLQIQKQIKELETSGLGDAVEEGGALNRFLSKNIKSFDALKKEFEDLRDTFNESLSVVDDAERERLAELNRIEFSAKKEQNEKLKKLDKDRNASRVSLEKSSSELILGSIATVTNARDQESKKAFKIAKVASVAEATVNTYRAATAALPNIPLMIATIATGLAQVAQIQSTSFGGGGGSGGGVIAPQTITNNNDNRQLSSSLTINSTDADSGTIKQIIEEFQNQQQEAFNV